jgi:hypothetical protein
MHILLKAGRISSTAHHTHPYASSSEEGSLPHDGFSISTGV